MKVLVVDDDAAIRELAATYLQREGYVVLTACDGEEALTRARGGRPNLILLDLMLSRRDSFKLYRLLRAESDVPILMLAARDDGLVGHEINADDYLTKPFNPRDLVARVKAVVHRTARGAPTSMLLTAGPLAIDRARREARIGDRVLELRAKEFDLLSAFVEHADLALTRARLLEEVWGYSVPGRTRTVDVHVSHLRSRLAGAGVAIETLRGVGYKLVIA